MFCQKWRNGGGATLPPPRPPSPAGRERGCCGAGGSPRWRERGAPSPGSGGGRQGRAPRLAGRACRASRCGEGAGAPAGGQQKQTGPEGHKKGSCMTEGVGALGWGRGRGRGGARRGLSAAQDCILRQKLS